MAGLNVVAADTDEEARHLFTTTQQGFTNLVRGTPGPFQPPLGDIAEYWTPAEKVGATRMLARSVVGSPQAVHAGLEQFAELTGVDEIMVVTATYEHAARIRSYEIVAEAWLT
jgi:alkanesulfonate monooxygenase SsuD/methylene tetrahydromethanopterin reductase-like flavin-dependent oxidoreductase (luciferase family)